MSSSAPPRALRSPASTLVALCWLSLLAWSPLLAFASPSAGAILEPRSQSPFSTPEATPPSYDALGLQRVNVTLAVMSRCPDALACEATFDKVLDRVNAKTRVTMTYIGSLDDEKHHSKYGVECMHGEQECDGNVQQLCVQDALNPVRAGEDFDLSPSAAQKKWWNFLQCQNYAGLSKIGDKGLAQRCLRLVNGPSWDKDGIAKCVHGKQGRKLLQHSVKASKRRNLTTSCTIQFENGKKCVRDGRSWKNCDLGHEPSDFIEEIERIWASKNADARSDLDAASSKTASHSATRLQKRQSSASATNTDFGNPFAGSRTPPSVFTLIIAIALFVIVVCFVLLRILMRNRRLRRLGLLPEGPFDRLLGPTREIEDTLTPPKLLEARIAHDFRPAAYDADVKAKSWDALMPISAAVPPLLYSDLFPNSSKVKGQEAGNAEGEGAQNGGDGFSYPPSSTQAGGLTRRLHVPSFLRRHGDDDDPSVPGAGSGSNGAAYEAGLNGSEGDSKRFAADASTSASVNVTVLIAMPSQRTIFPSTQSAHPTTLKTQRSLNMDGVAKAKIDEVEESADFSEPKLRRTASIKSFRTVGSTKSVGEARREAFFNKMNDDEGNTAANEHLPTTQLDDEDEEELPELVFGTASVPIFARISGPDAAGREPFSGTSEAYQPLRSELVRLVTSAHDARERKAAIEAAAKQAEKDTANADDGQTTIDERSTNQGQAAISANVAGPTADGRRVSASETIDSETAAIIGTPGLATVPTSQHQEGLGNVVSRMMMPEPNTGSQHAASTSDNVTAGYSYSQDPRPSIGIRSEYSRADTSTPVREDGRTPFNTSTHTLDPLLGGSAGSYASTGLRNETVAQRNA